MGRLWALAFLLSGSAAAAPQGPPQPYIHPRAVWGGGKSGAEVADPEKVRIIVHHSDIPVLTEEKLLKDGDSLQAAVAHIKKIRHLHTVVNGWADIGYHYMIDWEGRVFQARPVGLLGAHTDDHNLGSIGIILMGAFESQHATSRQLAALAKLCAWLGARHQIPPEKILGHKHFNATACPGHYLEDLSDPQTPLRKLRLGLIASGKLKRDSVPDDAPPGAALQSLVRISGAGIVPLLRPLP